MTEVFLDTAYAIADPDVAAERRALLDNEARLCIEPLLEPVPAYVSTNVTIAEAVAQSGFGEQLK